MACWCVVLLVAVAVLSKLGVGGTGRGWVMTGVAAGDLMSGVGIWLRLSVLLTPSSIATGRMTSLSWMVDGCR